MPKEKVKLPKVGEIWVYDVTRGSLLNGVYVLILRSMINRYDGSALCRIKMLNVPSEFKKHYPDGITTEMCKYLRFVQ